MFTAELWLHDIAPKFSTIITDSRTTRDLYSSRACSLSRATARGSNFAEQWSPQILHVRLSNSQFHISYPLRNRLLRLSNCLVEFVFAPRSLHSHDFVLLNTKRLRYYHCEYLSTCLPTISIVTQKVLYINERRSWITLQSLRGSYQSLSVPRYTFGCAWPETIVARKKLTNQEGSIFVDGSQVSTSSLCPLLRCWSATFVSLAFSSVTMESLFSNRNISELRPHGYPMRIDGVFGQCLAHVRASISRAHVATTANHVLHGFTGCSISGSWRVTEVLSLQEHRDLPECRPLALLASPTVEHQIVNILWARGGLR